MKNILFIRSEKAYLPEVDAYIKYFNKTKEFRAYDSLKLNGYAYEDFDVIWEFKGFGGVKAKKQILIHEYASLSTGAFPLLKNMLKAKINPKPDLRIFLNENVKAGFNFNDNIEYCSRDMGIDEKFIQARNSNKEYDFIYVGSISKNRGIDKLLKIFTENKNGRLCLIGEVDDDIYNMYKKNKDIIFTGKVPYDNVPEIASRAIYGINYIPDKYPFNIQTSTKLLEYLALDLKVITTDYKWVRQFEKQHDCSFYKLDLTNLEFNMGKIEKHEFVSNFKAEEFIWDKIIEQAGLKMKLAHINGNASLR